MALASGALAASLRLTMGESDCQSQMAPPYFRFHCPRRWRTSRPRHCSLKLIQLDGGNVQMTILFIDSDPDTIKTYVRALEREDYKVEVIGYVGSRAFALARNAYYAF